MTPVEELVRAAIERRGPLPFDEVMALALYDPEHGFYATGGRAGRRGDFLTSPEVGPLFGAVVARALDAWWAEAGEPDVFIVVEAGAGPGHAGAVGARPPRRAARRRCATCSSRCPSASGPATPSTSRSSRRRSPSRARPIPTTTSEPRRRPPTGPIVVSLAGPAPGARARASCSPTSCSTTCPFGSASGPREGWDEVRVGLEGDDARRGRRAADRRTRRPRRRRSAPACPVASDAAPTGCATRSRSPAAGGRVVAFDYASTTAELARRPWTSGSAPTAATSAAATRSSALGEQDITCEVAVDQLPAPDARRRARPTGCAPTASTSWSRRAARSGASGPPSATSRPCRARSRVTEAEALLDPAGLGAFRVLEWDGRLTVATRGTCRGGARRCTAGVAAGVEGADRLGQVLGEAEHELVAVLQLDRRLEAAHLEVRPQHVLGHGQAVGAEAAIDVGDVEAARRAARRRGAPATPAPSPAPRRRRPPAR